MSRRTWHTRSRTLNSEGKTNQIRSRQVFTAPQEPPGQVVVQPTAAGPAEVERSASFEATAAVTSAPQRVLQRQTALSATAAVTSSGTHIHSRSVALSASAGIASSPQRALLRSTALGATGAIASSGAVVTTGPPVFESATAHTGNPGSGATVTLPTTAANDILILVWVNGGATATPTLTTGTFTEDANFTLIDSGTWAGGDGGAGGCHWVRCTGNHSGQTVILTGTTDSASALVIRISGCKTSGSPIDASTGATINVPGPTQPLYTLTGFSTGVGESLVCIAVATDDNTAKLSPTKNAVAMSNLSAATNTAGNDSGVGYADSEQSSTGATGDFTISEASGTATGKRFSAFSLTPAVLAPTVYERSASLSATASITSSGAALSGVLHRAFDGVGNLESSTNVNNLTGAFTAAAVIRQTTSGTTPFIWLHATSGYAARASMSLSAAGLLSVGTGSARVAPTLSLVAADGWGIVVVSKAAGTATPRFHVYKGGSWSHENASGTVADALTHSGGRVLFGTSVAVDYRIDLAVAGEWNSALSDGDIETLDWATQNWADLSPLSLWDFDQTVTTDTIPDLAGAVDLAGVAGVPIDTDGPDGWVYGVGATHERSASLSATAAIASAPQRVRLRSAALSATAAIASDGHGILSRSAALTATASIASAPQRVRVRSAALSATGSVTSTAVFFSIVERAGALTALASLSVGAYQRVHVRSASFTATAQIASASQAAGVHSRSASLTAAGSIAAAGQRALHRSASFGASTTFQATPERALSRQASLGATAGIAATPEIAGATERSASFTATASIVATGEITAAVERSASFTATAGISASPQRVLNRRAILSGFAWIETTPQRVRVRSVALSASASIAVAGHIAEVFTRSSSILAVAEISATGVVFGPGPTEETHPKLGGVFDETVTGGIVAVSANGGTVAESSRGGTVTEPSRGATVPALRSGVVLEPSRGGEPDGDQSGDFDELLTGGRVAEYIRNGLIANGRGAVLNEPARGGVLTLVRSGTPTEPKRGGTFDESLTNGEVL